MIRRWWNRLSSDRVKWNQIMAFTIAASIRHWIKLALQFLCDEIKGVKVLFKGSGIFSPASIPIFSSEFAALKHRKNATNRISFIHVWGMLTGSGHATARFDSNRNIRFRWVLGTGSQRITRAVPSRLACFKLSPTIPLTFSRPFHSFHCRVTSIADSNNWSS